MYARSTSVPMDRSKTETYRSGDMKGFHARGGRLALPPAQRPEE